jgi:hypothetical protein
MDHIGTPHALDTLAKWGKNPTAYGGENITFSLCRQGAPSDSFMVSGDCTAFTPAGARGTLNGPPAGTEDGSITYIIDFSGPTLTIDQVPTSFSFDLNAGKVTLTANFPNLPPSLSFTVQSLTEFDADGGKNILFHSNDASDNAAYVLVVELVAAS